MSTTIQEGMKSLEMPRVKKYKNEINKALSSKHAKAILENTSSHFFGKGYMKISLTFIPVWKMYKATVRRCWEESS